MIVQQQYSSTAENTRHYARGGGRYSGQKKKKSNNNKCSGTPNHARAGPIWRCLRLHASGRPPLALYVLRIIEQHIRWYRVRSCVVQGCTVAHALVQQVQQCWDFHFLTIIRHPEERAIRPR